MKKNNFLVTMFTFLLAMIVLTFGCKKENKENNQLSQDNNSSVGTSSNAFLSDEYYEKLTIEVLYMSGYKPTETALNNMRSFLIEHLNKPAGVEVVTQEIPSGEEDSYSTNVIMNIETQHREMYNANETIAASLIIVNGEYAENDQVLGIAYRNTSMALFGGTIEANSGGLSQPTRTKLESTVMNHELGHLLGLVNMGTDMVDNHEDSENSKHCNDKDCLMYYASETTEVASFLIGNDIPSLDTNCKEDLVANGGKQ